jgi:hypothetical protein
LCKNIFLKAPEQNDWQEFKPLFGGGKIKICDTLRAVTPFGGLSVFIEFLGRIGLVEQLASRAPYQPKSANHYAPGQILVGFILSVIAGAQRFAHANQLRADRALHALLGMQRFPSDDTILNYFRRFNQAEIDASGGPCGAGLSVGFRHWKRVVARLTSYLKSRLYQVTEWQSIDKIYCVTEFDFKLCNWKTQRRFVAVREEVQTNKAAEGRKLIDLPGYVFRVFVTNRSDSALEIWRDYNGRATVECRIDELKNQLAADHFCLRSFFATDSAFLAVLFGFNLLSEFQRALDPALKTYKQPATLRFEVFTCDAILGRSGHRLVLHMSKNWGGYSSRKPFFNKLLHWPPSTSPKFDPPTKNAA